MTLFLIFSSAGILIIISLIHVYWAFGGRWGISATFPVKEDEASTEIVPPTLITLIAAFFFSFFLSFYWLKVGIYLFIIQMH